MGELEATAVAADALSRERFADVETDAASTAWLVALPLALVAVPLIALLAKPVGTLVVPQLETNQLFPWVLHYFRPEPREEGLYLLSLAATALLALGILVALGRDALASPRTTAALSALARGLLALVLVASIVAQYRIRYEWTQREGPHRFFSPATLVVGAAVAAGIVAALRSERARTRIAGALRETRARRLGALAAAAAITVAWMLQAVQTDRSVAWAAGEILAHLPYTSDETFAVVNGLTPLVNASPAYAALWSYVAALPLAVVGKTLLVFTLTTSAITTLALLSGFGILRRAVGSSVGALALYLPFLATSLFIVSGEPANGFTPATSLSDFPLRYAGPLLLAWLTARELERPGERAPWALCAAAGLVLLNNVGVGLPALGATLVALAATRPWTVRSLLALARGAVAGVLLAVAAVTLLTLARAGELPRFGQLSEFSRVYLAGYAATSLHGVLGVHLAVFLTYVAAIATAAVRLRTGAEGRVMNGMLVWTGVFGLGAFSYFVAESGPLWLIASFSTWALALLLLAVLVVRRLAARSARRPDLAELAVLLGVGVTVCSLAQFPTPWSQVARLTERHLSTRPSAAEVEPYRADPRARAFVASLADGRRFYLKRGAPVAFLFENGHRIADAYGVVNVSPYSNEYELITRESLRKVVAALRKAGGNTVVLSQSQEPAADLDEALSALGFGIVTRDGIARVRGPVRALVRNVRGEALVKWVDLRHLHPRALRDERGRLRPGVRSA